MITYLINSALCSALLLVIYHLLLKNKAMYTFNRFYLLISVLFSLIVPLIAVHQDAAVITPVLPVHQYLEAQAQIFVPEVLPAKQKQTITGSSGFSSDIVWYIYAIVTCLFLFRFARNLYLINRSIETSEQEEYKGLKLILLSEKLIPHTFLNYIFLNKKEYESRKVADNILRHEMAHARQWHSADVIFIELIRIFYWVNPVIIFYRNAILLNHEFIADSAVLQTEHDVEAYQHLLVSKTGLHQSHGITSQLNYSLTKQRLIMMTKRTSLATAWFTRLTVLPLMLIAFMLFCNMADGIKKAPLSISKIMQTKPVAKSTSIPPKVTSKWPPGSRFPSSATPASQGVLDQYAVIADKYAAIYKNKPIVTAADKSKMESLFRQMNKEQQLQQKIVFDVNISKPIPLHVPTKSVFESFKDASVYGVWINEKYVKNEELNKYKASDFSNYEKLNLAYTDKMKQNIMKKFNLAVMYKYQLELMTNDYYNGFNAKISANKNKSMMFYVVNKGHGYWNMRSEDF